MPFDASGNFTRNYNFVQDAANGIKILAARVDGEFDNIATGMNAVFFRDGRVPMQADLRMNSNGITGLKDGTLGSPAIKFQNDPNSGFYSPGLNQFGVQVNSAQRGVFTTAGFDVVGNLTNTGTHVSTGNVTAPSFIEGATALSAKYAALAGATFTGAITSTTFSTSGAAGAFIAVPRSGSGGNTTLYSNAGDTFSVFQNGADRLSVQPTAVTIAPQLNANTSVITPLVAVTSATGALYFQPRNADLTSQPFAYSPASNDLRFNCGGDRLQLTNTLATFNQNVAVNGGSGTFRSLFFQTNGATVASVDLLNDNTTFRYNTAATGIHRFDLNGTEKARIDATGFTVPGQIAATGAQASIVSNNQNGAGYWSAYNFNNVFNLYFSATGAVKFSVDSTGSVSSSVINCDDIITKRASSPTTGAIFFGNSGARYLYWDGSGFTLQGSLAVGGNITSSSDARLKTNVRDLENPLALVKAFRPVRFDMYGKADVGFIAQEMQTVLPEVVCRDSNGFLSIDYGRLTAVLAGAVQNLDARLNRIEAALGL